MTDSDDKLVAKPEASRTQRSGESDKLAAKREALRAKRSGDPDAVTANALRNYRISAWVVGVPLALLFLVAMPIKYFGDDGTLVKVIGIGHGWLYMIYIVLTVLLAMNRRWSIGRTVLVVVGGTIPLVSFWTEHVVHEKVTAREPGW